MGGVRNKHPLQRCQSGPQVSHDASGGPSPSLSYKPGGIHKNPLLLSRRDSITYSNPLKLSLSTIMTLDHLVYITELTSGVGVQESLLIWRLGIVDSDG